jgi:predicted GNAT superfamily acetyltransferase
VEKVHLRIRRLESDADFHACQALIQRIWSMPDGLEVLPLHIMAAVPRNGGLLLGAFDGDDLVGYVFGFPGITAGGKRKHCSHMMGVAPDYQVRGIGYQLKLAQREHLLARGCDLVTWTYDPLASRNAYLNLAKLGVVCCTYVQDYYGPMTDGLNAGLPADRLQVDWWIASERVQQRLERAAAPSLPEGTFLANEPARTASGLLEPGRLRLDGSEEEWVAVELPADYQAIKAADMGLALAWRLALRQLFQAYFAAGHAAVDFVTEGSGGERRSYYILRAEHKP